MTEKSFKLLDAIAKGFAIIASTATLVLMIALCADVVSRVVMHRSLPGMVELSETCLVFIIFGGMGYASLERAHIGVDILSNAVSQTMRVSMRILAGFFTLVFLTWAVYATGRRAISSFATGEYKFGLLEWPVWPSRWAITIGLVLALIVTLKLIATDIRSLLQGKENNHGR